MKKIIVLTAAAFLCTGAEAQTDSYTVANIVTNTQDSHLVNPWASRVRLARV